MRDDEIEPIINRWNMGRLSPGELVGELSDMIASIHAPNSLGPSRVHIERLRQRLWADRPLRFRSVTHFAGYAARAMYSVDEELVGSHYFAESETVLRWLREVRSGYKYESIYEYDSAYEREFRSPETIRKRQEAIEYEDLRRGEVSPAGQSSSVSFSSLGFAPMPSKTDDQPPLGLLPEMGAFIEKWQDSDIGLARLATLRIFGGLTLPEIAARTSMPLSTVRRIWERVRNELSSSERNEVSPRLILPSDDALLRSLRDHPDLLTTLNWRSFEKVLASLLGRLGFEIELQKGTKDGGIDIFALRSDPAFGAHRYLIQAKRWSHTVGVSTVREILFLQNHHRVSKGCLATTAYFSRGAWKLAKEYKWQLELRDMRGLQDWIALALEESVGG